MDGTDYQASAAVLQQAVAYARERRGPALVHAHVVRPYSHSLSDDERLYKTPAEREAEAARDPIALMRRRLLEDGLATEAELQQMLRRRRTRGERRGRPRAAGAEAGEGHGAPVGVLARRRSDVAGLRHPAEPSGKPDTMVAAINRTLRDEMARNPAIVMFGEDVADATREAALSAVSGKGGVFKVTHGLQRTFGATRVFNSPLAEANIIGRAVGMATRGIKPVVEIQFFDYIWPAMMQLRDEMAMLRYRSGNNFSCPMVVRVPDRRLPARRRALPQPVGREHLRALPGHPHRCTRRTPWTPPASCAPPSAATTR